MKILQQFHIHVHRRLFTWYKQYPKSTAKRVHSCLKNILPWTNYVGFGAGKSGPCSGSWSLNKNQTPKAITGSARNPVHSFISFNGLRDHPVRGEGAVKTNELEFVWQTNFSDSPNYAQSARYQRRNTGISWKSWILPDSRPAIWEYMKKT